MTDASPASTRRCLNRGRWFLIALGVALSALLLVVPLIAIFAGALASGPGALPIAHALPGSKIVVIICDRGDRYLSGGFFPDRVAR